MLCFTAAAHFNSVRPDMVAMVPPGVPNPEFMVTFTGICEILGAGHERDNATAEVRRFSAGNYGPLYQAAYLLGGLQLRGMKREIVDSGQRSEKDFHDEIMRQGGMPVAMLRLAVSKQKLTRDMVVDWKFYGENPGR
jgi:hypothetical protein